jgi:hypothetical protein
MDKKAKWLFWEWPFCPISALWPRKLHMLIRKQDPGRQKFIYIHHYFVPDSWLKYQKQCPFKAWRRLMSGLVRKVGDHIKRSQHSIRACTCMCQLFSCAHWLHLTGASQNQSAWMLATPKNNWAQSEHAWTCGGHFWTKSQPP